MNIEVTPPITDNIGIPVQAEMWVGKFFALLLKTIVA
jgi:hypothetical protein